MMKITVDQLRNIIVETIVNEAEVPDMGYRGTIVRSADEHTGEMSQWIGNIERIRVGLLNLGVNKEDRNAILSGEKYLDHELVKRLKRHGDIKSYMDPALAPDPKAPPTRSRVPGAVRAPSKPKETYKIYPGGTKYRGSPAVTRVKGKVYIAPTDTKFNAGEQAAVEPRDGRLRVRKTDNDHEQTWEPE